MTRRSRGSREKPRAMSEDVAAKSGPEWPRTYSANAYAPTAQTVIWMAGTREFRLRTRPVRILAAQESFCLRKVLSRGPCVPVYSLALHYGRTM